MEEILEKKTVKLFHEELTYKIIGAAMDVHKELGSGFLEAVYEEAMIIELNKAKIPFANQTEIDICYKGEKLKKKYRADFIVDNKLMVDLKSTSGINEVDEAQMINYLKACNVKVGLIINFGKIKLDWKRIVC